MGFFNPYPLLCLSDIHLSHHWPSAQGCKALQVCSHHHCENVLSPGFVVSMVVIW